MSIVVKIYYTILPGLGSLPFATAERMAERHYWKRQLYADRCQFGKRAS